MRRPLSLTPALTLALASVWIATAPACALDAGNATASLTELCTSMPGMPGCTLKNLCTANTSALAPPYCHPISLVGAICLVDTAMTQMSACNAYTQSCTTNATCQALTPPPKYLPPSSTLARDIYSICTQMSMPGCSACRLTLTSSYADCDMLTTYSQLCKAMPAMAQCQDYKAFCGTAPGSGSDLCPASGAASGAVPEMKMYFHTGIVDYVLFQGWVPQTNLQYAFTVIACFLLAIVYEGLQAWHAILDMRLAPKARVNPKPLPGPQPSSSSASTDSTTPLTAPRPPPASRKLPSLDGWKAVLLRGTLRMMSATLVYALMLIVMTYNVGLFLATVVGLGVGSMLTSPVINYAERSLVGANSDWELCC
ncbi:hypothetical protein SeLEV6574_g00891 [Synchytrium endobioticum]|uniref:Copper transport protein n=1 Tax=Synchytrium endobioticum TaxID=286115 RepID=A0A507DFT6_9FUNG|nr:hypothetical protein SeLEV6574_g00891 [Synchytrium endobioticum]